MCSVLLAMVLCGCSRSKIVVEGRVIGSTSEYLYLESVGSIKTDVVDSVALGDKGNFKFSFEGSVEHPTLYNVVCGGERIPLFLVAGDVVKINAIGNVALGYRVEGSEESELLRQFYQPYLKGVSELDRIATQHASEHLHDDNRQELTRKYGQEYQAIKQAQLKFIIENKSTLAAVYALFQRLPGDEYLFNESSDVIYFRTVADALEQSYPGSSYLRSLRSAVSRMESSLSLKTSREEISFPEIDYADMYGESKKLSSLVGRVILLNFWSPEAGNSNVQNAELREIYKKYRNLGFEIYQVGVTASKSDWVTLVQDQRLEWISVSDLRGANSPSLGFYNVSALPTSFLIDRNGDIVARDVVIDDTLEAKIEKLLL